MIRRFWLACVATFVLIAVSTAYVQPVGAVLYSADVTGEVDYFVDSVSAVEYPLAKDVFVNAPISTLDLLHTRARLDMIDYYEQADSLLQMPNAMDGVSYICRPINDDCITIQLTPVSSLSIKILPYKKNYIAVTCYTVGDSTQAYDTQLRFFDAIHYNELDADKYIKLLEKEDFFDFKGLSKKERNELLELVPFLTVKYEVSTGVAELVATFTADTYMSEEAKKRIEPYLVRTRRLLWNKDKFRLVGK